MDRIEELLRLLEDGKWHRITEIYQSLKTKETSTKRLVEFLSEHGLVHYRSSDESVKIDSDLLALLRET